VHRRLLTEAKVRQALVPWVVEVSSEAGGLVINETEFLKEAGIRPG